MAPPSLGALHGKRTPEVITAEGLSGAASAPKTIPPRTYANAARASSASSPATQQGPMIAGDKRRQNEQALWKAQKKTGPTCVSGPSGFRTEAGLGSKSEEQPGTACASGPSGYRTEVEQIHGAAAQVRLTEVWTETRLTW